MLAAALSGTPLGAVFQRLLVEHRKLSYTNPLAAGPSHVLRELVIDADDCSLLLDASQLFGIAAAVQLLRAAHLRFLLPLSDDFLQPCKDLLGNAVALLPELLQPEALGQLCGCCVLLAAQQAVGLQTVQLSAMTMVLQLPVLLDEMAAVIADRLAGRAAAGVAAVVDELGGGLPAAVLAAHSEAEAAALPGMVHLVRSGHYPVLLSAASAATEMGMALNDLLGRFGQLQVVRGDVQLSLQLPAAPASIAEQVFLQPFGCMLPLVSPPL
jgi:hypothetical protein